MTLERALIAVLLIEVAIATTINIRLLNSINHLNASANTITSGLHQVGLA